LAVDGAENFGGLIYGSAGESMVGAKELQPSLRDVVVVASQPGLETPG
jgi:hypothetical protein